MKKKEALAILGEYKKQCARRYGILSLGLFGSTARDAASEASDVDVVVTLAKPDLFTMAGIKYELEERMHHPIDLVVYREKMNLYLKQRIDEEAVYV
ncbi:nucleotidyltransferase family protein [Thiovibrio sp. JS02]